MTDLHTHILPGMDDGARNCDVSIRMLKMEREQGADAVALTPHFYPERENIASFLSRRSAACSLLQQQIDSMPRQEQALLPKLIIGAEVAWIRGLGELPGLEKLCYEGSRYLLVELPFRPWDERVLNDLNDVMNRTGLIPVIAHVDRYFSIQSSKQLKHLFEFGLPVQISAAAFSVLRFRRKLRKVLENGIAQLIISDCHDATGRSPNVREAYGWIEKKYGHRFARTIAGCSDDLLR